jgi:hypothetical protein
MATAVTSAAAAGAADSDTDPTGDVLTRCADADINCLCLALPCLAL